MTNSPDIKSTFAACKICTSTSRLLDTAEILRKYKVQYFHCEQCGFIQTETPYWLEEAYSSAIARQDVGIMQRNLNNCRVTAAVLNLLFPNASAALDCGAGHGVFVRLMRDRGFQFHWWDPYATNDYARGFERQDGLTYDFLTAFEVLEHLTDPIEELAKLMQISANVFVSTCIVPKLTPKISDWWYYVPSTGQHIAFYTPEALQLLAKRFGRHLLSVGPYHLFSAEPKSERLYRLAMNQRTGQLINRFRRRESLVQSDFYQMTH